MTSSPESNAIGPGGGPAGTKQNHPMKVNVSALIGLAGLVAWGCSGAACANAVPAAAQEVASGGSELAPARLIQREWVLVGLEGKPVEVAEERGRPTLRFDPKEARVSGMSGVNRYGGRYTIEGAALTFGPLLATKMAGPPEQNALETRFLWALEATTSWRVAKSGELELLAGTRVVARFTPRAKAVGSK
jgi:heat shock protein HslJ